MDDLMSDLFDHEIEAYEEIPDTLSISTKLARKCDKTGVVDIQRSGMPLMKTKFCENSATENDILGCFNSSIKLSLCPTEADKRLLLADTAELACQCHVSRRRDTCQSETCHSGDKRKHHPPNRRDDQPCDIDQGQQGCRKARAEMSCALQIENNLVKNGVEISESGTSTASSQSIDSKGDIRTSAQQKDEHTKESARDPPLTARSLVLFNFISVSAHRNSHRSLAVLKFRSGDELLDQSRLTEMKTTIDLLHVKSQGSLQGTRSP